MGLLWDLIKNVNSIEEKNKSKEIEDKEKEMDSYNLEDWQKELVRKGEYEPWNFDEDDSEDEDDYYHEDD